MPYGDYAECPQCGAIAYGEDEIEDIFGYRYDGTKTQSWCKECRGGSSEEALSVDDAALIWASKGCDEDYTFGYDEDDLRDALNES